MALCCPVNYSIWFFCFKNTPYKFLICYICAIKSNLFFNLLYSFQITCISKFINQNYFISLSHPLPDKFTSYKAGSACNKKLFHTALLLINPPVAQISSFEEADVMKKPCHRHLTALPCGLPAFSGINKSEIYGHVYQNKILSICRGFSAC